MYGMVRACGEERTKGKRRADKNVNLKNSSLNNYIKLEEDFIYISYMSKILLIFYAE
jgi:hypothetical protein